MRFRTSPLARAWLSLLAASAGAGPASASAQGGEPAPALRPSIALIIIDTLRADALGCYGNRHGPSPELDELAAQGVRFARAIAQCSWTRPSVASLLTSLYPRTLAIDGNERAALAERFTTLAEALRQHGYRTIGATANPHLNRTFNMAQGFDVYFDSRWEWRRGGGTPLPFPDARRILGALRHSVERDAREGRRGPYYLQANLLEPHEHKHPRRWRRSPNQYLFPELPDGAHKRYFQALRQVSADVGRFVRELRGREGFEDALFVVTSDHGEGLSDHPAVWKSMGHGRLLYESQLLVPLLLYTPGQRLPRGRVVPEPVRLLDLMPTLLDYAGVPSPGGLRGVSLLPLLEGRPVPLPERFVVETRYRGHRKIGVYESDWKLLLHRDRHRGTAPSELQARGRENGRRTDRSAEHPEAAARLAAFLAQWERDHPDGPATLIDRLSDRERDQLRALGYAN